MNLIEFKFNVLSTYFDIGISHKISMYKRNYELKTF